MAKTIIKLTNLELENLVKSLENILREKRYDDVNFTFDVVCVKSAADAAYKKLTNTIKTYQINDENDLKILNALVAEQGRHNDFLLTVSTEDKERVMSIFKDAQDKIQKLYEIETSFEIEAKLPLSKIGVVQGLDLAAIFPVIYKDKVKEVKETPVK